MKVYEKPKLMVLSVSANDALCACDTSLRYNEGLKNALALIAGDKAPPLNETEMKNVFTTDDDCADQISYEGYCKFTGAQNVFIS